MEFILIWTLIGLVVKFSEVIYLDSEPSWNYLKDMAYLLVGAVFWPFSVYRIIRRKLSRRD